MTSDTSASPKAERRKRGPAVIQQPKDYGWAMYLIVITLLLVIGFFISHDGLYKPGDKIGYNLGLVGGLMMLTLLIYPIRKRVGFMMKWGLLPKWFKWHMIFGILGPAFIVFHSTFYIGSINAAVALICMLLVSGSGIFGRFFYTKIHYGLFGRSASFKEMQESLQGSGNVKSIFSFAPDIQKKLEAFHDYAISIPKAGKFKLYDFMKVGVRAELLTRELIRELEDVMYLNTSERQWNDAQMKRLDELFYANEKFIRSYLLNVRDLAQLGTYEKLFSLWHLFHVPLVYMLVFSGIWHVIAVHMF